ncbi:hypothetical protein [Nocardia grenadensis]|uniref:hypothetical protein n=1 Tax=Nocardia grenadensis TaxID=931537 RepID=UPI003D91B6B5
MGGVDGADECCCGAAQLGQQNLVVGVAEVFAVGQVDLAERAAAVAAELLPGCVGVETVVAGAHQQERPVQAFVGGAAEVAGGLGVSHAAVEIGARADALVGEHGLGGGESATGVTEHADAGQTL